MTWSCPRFCDQALYSSGVLQIRPPRSANVFLKLCGLKYGSPTDANASLNICLIGPALLQCLRFSPAASNRRLGADRDLVSPETADRPAPIVFHAAGSSPNRPPLAQMSSPTGKKLVTKDLENLVRTSRASWSILTFGNIDVPELERGDRAVASAGQDRERD